VEEIAAIRLSDFAEVQGMSRASQMKAGTLLADVEKALAVVEQGLLVSERALFYVERLPRLVTLQTELLLDQVAAAPDAERMRTNPSKLAAASEQLSLVVTDFPKYVTGERQAAIDHVFMRFGSERQQVMNDLASQENRLRGLFEEVRGLLDRANPLTDKLNTTVHSADALYRLFEAKPINLSQYNDLLEKSNVVMDKLAGILAEVKPLYAAISGDSSVRVDSLLGKIVGLADHLFWRGMLLIAFFLVGLLGVLLAYKTLSFRMTREHQKG
jgi:ABC-type transporter Mla subunit MlaD